MSDDYIRVDSALAVVDSVVRERDEARAEVERLRSALQVIAGWSIHTSWRQIAKAQQEIARRALEEEAQNA